MSTLASLRARVPMPLKMRYRATRSYLKLLKYSLYDLVRYARHSATCRSSRTTPQDDADITRIYHAIEKGLSIRSPRPGFGKDVIANLCRLLQNRLSNGGVWTQSCADAIDALEGYVAFNQRAGTQIDPAVARTLDLARSKGHAISQAPTKMVRRADILAATAFDADAFFWSRHSVRQFDTGPIDRERLLRGLAFATSAPSVCNRQSGRVKVVFRGEGSLDFLSLQNGNRGFGHEAQAIAVFTSDLSAFLDPTERYQAWIDGGMFAMAAALGLHSQGFGACCLNWSQTDAADRALRTALELPDDETVIMLMAIGNLPEEFPVARSHRLPLSEVVEVLVPAGRNATPTLVSAKEAMGHG